MKLLITHKDSQGQDWYLDHRPDSHNVFVRHIHNATLFESATDALNAFAKWVVDWDRGSCVKSYLSEGEFKVVEACESIRVGSLV